VFLFRSRLLIHLANHEKYKCPLPHCGVGFTRLKDLDEHMLDVHQIEKLVQTTNDDVNASTSRDNGGHACPLCDKKFAFQSVLIRHVAQHDKHKCLHCQLGFTKSNLLDRHVAEAHPEHGGNVVVEGNGHNCHMCDKVFPFPSALKVHLAAHKYKCNYCEQIFTRQSAVDSHVREEHPGEWVEVEAKVENRCEICQKVFEYPSALKLHVAWHNKHKCRYCEACFPRLNLLEGHVRDEHPEEWDSVHSESKATNNNRCHLCNKVLPYPSALKLHLAWHSKHKCPHDSCTNAFPTLMLLDDHVRTEHPDKWEERRPEPKLEYHCDMCDKVFPFPSALKLHLAWHTKYQCINCGQPFPTRILLNGHICQHSKEPKTEVDCEASVSFAIKQEAPDFDDSGEMMMEH
jgi:KRAB domain-containing zinc finger protein